MPTRRVGQNMLALALHPSSSQRQIINVQAGLYNAGESQWLFDILSAPSPEDRMISRRIALTQGECWKVVR